MLKTTPTSTQTDENRAVRYARATRLLGEWLREAELEGEGDHDWDALDRELNDSALSCREPGSEERASS